MHIVAIGWIYVVLMMAITEHSVIAGIMTFLMYGVVPLAIILYLTGTQRRRRNRALKKKSLPDSGAESADTSNTHDSNGNAALQRVQENHPETRCDGRTD